MVRPASEYQECGTPRTRHPDTSSLHQRPGFRGTWRTLKGFRWHVAGSHTCALRPGGVPELGTPLPSSVTPRWELKRARGGSTDEHTPKLANATHRGPLPPSLGESCCETQSPGWGPSGKHHSPPPPAFCPSSHFAGPQPLSTAHGRVFPGSWRLCLCHSVTPFKHS